MNAFLTVTRQSFIQLRRDKVFLPVIAVCFLIALFASIASNWSIENFDRMLFDTGIFGFSIAGSIVAIFWGTRAVIDPGSGVMESQLAAPIHRSVWVLGRYMGLVLSLVTFLVAILVIWQVLLLMDRAVWIQPNQLVAFLFMGLGWVVLASAAMFFASFCSLQVAQFATGCAWIIGLCANLVHRSILEDSPGLIQNGLELVVLVWNLQSFNLIEFAANPEYLGAEELMWRGIHGVTLVATLCTATCLIFRKRNLNL